MELKINTRTVDGVSIVDCSGRLVFGDEAALVRETVKGLLANSKKIVLNLKNVSYIDSGGLGTLVGLYSSARNSGAEVKLCSLTDRVGQLLQVTKLLTVFDVRENEDAAVRSFKQAANA